MRTLVSTARSADQWALECDVMVVAQQDLDDAGNNYHRTNAERRTQNAERSPIPCLDTTDQARTPGFVNF